MELQITKTSLPAETTAKIKEAEEIIKRYKEMLDDIKEDIKREMENQGIVKIDTDDITITYIAETERETFDSKKLKEDNKALYDEYIRFSPVKSSIRVKVK